MRTATRSWFIARVRRALIDAGHAERAAEFCAAAVTSESYAALLRLVEDHCDVE